MPDAADGIDAEAADDIHAEEWWGTLPSSEPTATLSPTARGRSARSTSESIITCADPHLHRDWAHPCPHLRRDWAHPTHVLPPFPFAHIHLSAHPRAQTIRLARAPPFASLAFGRSCATMVQRSARRTSLEPDAKSNSATSHATACRA